MTITISKIGLIITTIGSIMLIISGIYELFGIDWGLMGSISAQSPFGYFLTFLVILAPILLGVAPFSTGAAGAFNNDKIGVILSLLFSCVALIGGFIPLTLYGYSTLLCGSFFHLTFNGIWINYDAIIMIIGAIINTIGVFKD
ncbi:MAG: hypothetical protein ACFFHD_11380 [Promethearchaeota archaeon]